MTVSYAQWTKARLQAELRSRSLDDHGTTRELRERLREDDAGHESVDGDGGGGAAPAGTVAGNGGKQAESRQPADSRASATSQDGEGTRSAAAFSAHVQRRALAEIAAITGRPLERIVAVHPEDGGWRVTVDVVDYARVPSSGERLTTYEATVDGEGRVRDCARTGGHTRGRSGRRTTR